MPLTAALKKTVTLGAILVLLGGLAGTVQAQKITPETVKLVQDAPLAYEPEYSEWKDCGLRKGDIDAFVSHRPPQVTAKQKQATINVTYSSDFPDAAIEAYERAVSIWEAHLESDVEIRIDAGRIPDPESNILGGTIPNRFWALETDGGDQFYVGDALADALLNRDLGAEQTDESNPPDMLTDFNFDRTDWHFGESDAPSNEIDFTTVALHEIGHGLHYLSLCSFEEGNGQCKFDLSEGGQAGGVYSERVFERQSDGRLTALTDESAYSTSQELGDALTSDQLVFADERANSAAEFSTGPVPPKIYAPSSYEPGSSISHVDENTYGFEGPNALMTPTVEPAETNRQPGPIVCGQLADIGWTLGNQCLQYFQEIVDLRFESSSDQSTSSVTLDWTERDNANIQDYKIERRYFGGSYEVVKEGISGPPVTVEDLGIGEFSFRVRWVNSDGSEGTSIQTLSKTVNVEPTSSVESRTDDARANIDLSWNVPSGTPESVEYRIERAPGSGGGDFQDIATTQRSRLTDEGLTPGTYRYRVVSSDDNGNSLTSDVIFADIEFGGAVFIQGPFPNPAQDRSTVKLTARSAQRVTIEVFNTIGERVFSEERPLAKKRPTRVTFDSFDRRGWGSGVYIIRVSGREFTKTRQMVLVR